MNLTSNLISGEHFYRRVQFAVPTRSPELFTEFLPRGYAMTTLDSVEEGFRASCIGVKIRIGTLITIYDDLADNPSSRDPELLREIYRLPFDPCASRHPVAEIVSELWKEVLEIIGGFPNFAALSRIFDFDVTQFYNANRFSELLSENGSLANQIENRAYSPHNMGILIVGTVDLMASPVSKREIIIEESGRIRAIFQRCQVLARISNVLSTLKREIREADVTGEVICSAIERGMIAAGDLSLGDPLQIEQALLPIVEELRAERIGIISELRARSRNIRTFDARKYVDGFIALHGLHESMEGLI